MRESLIQDTVGVLEDFNFDILLYFSSCFDIAAQKKDQTLLIKVLENIDGLRHEHADELKKLSASLNASPLIIGEKSKTETLVNNVLYDRHGIPVITLGSLQSSLLGAYPERISSQGRIIAEINGEALREARKKCNVSVEDLAKQLDLNRESIYLYEQDKIRAKYEIARKIESFLNAHLIESSKPFHFFTNEAEKQTGIGKKLMMLDFDVSSFKRTNFDLLAKDDSDRIILLEKPRSTVKAVEFSDFFKGFFAVVSDEKMDCPSITKKEVQDISSKKDLVKLIKESR